MIKSLKKDLRQELLYTSKQQFIQIPRWFARRRVRGKNLNLEIGIKIDSCRSWLVYPPLPLSWSLHNRVSSQTDNSIYFIDMHHITVSSSCFWTTYDFFLIRYFLYLGIYFMLGSVKVRKVVQGLEPRREGAPHMRFCAQEIGFSESA